MNLNLSGPESSRFRPALFEQGMTIVNINPAIHCRQCNSIECLVDTDQKFVKCKSCGRTISFADRSIREAFNDFTNEDLDCLDDNEDDPLQ